MTAGKLTIAIVACCCASLALAAAAPAHPAHGHGAKSRVTIYPWPDGLFGYVKSPKAARCGNHRRVTVFQDRGKRGGSRADARIGSVRATRHHGFYRWTLKTSRQGRFYAKARRTSGCLPAASRSLRIRPGTGSGNDDNSYPPCGPYVAEANTSVCKLEGLSMQAFVCLPNGGILCTGRATGGPAPWGASMDGSPANGTFAWLQRDDRTFYTMAGGTLDGRDPGLGHSYTVTDGFAHDDGDESSGPHFYTPDLPGQAPGEVGGPLDLQFHLFPEERVPARIDINGYLYLKR